MLPRRRLDIGAADLAFSLVALAKGGDPAAAARRLEARFAPPGHALAALSVRSGLDALLGALALSPGDEILVSAVTIRDMVRIIEAHGLVPVPVDVDMRTLAVSGAALEAARSPRTRAVLVAHLFGASMPLEAVSAFARRHGLLLIEDCAQSFRGLDDTIDARADVSLLSFGTIKTATALGGALLRFADPALRERVARVQGGWPVQSPGAYLRRVVKYAGLVFAQQRPVYSVLARACALAGVDHDRVISGAVRGFAGPAFQASIRRRPCAALLALLGRRLDRYSPALVERRAAAARAFAAAAPDVERPGSHAARHGHWVFPVFADRPDELVRHLRRHGFDATRGASSLHAVPAPAARPDVVATGAQQAMARVVYLPVYEGVAPREIAGLAHCVAAYFGRERSAGAVRSARLAETAQRL